MNAVAHSSVFWEALIFALLALYALPVMIGAKRKIEGLGWIVVIILMLPGIGWPAAMALAFMLPRRIHMTYQSGAHYPRVPGQRW